MTPNSRAWAGLFVGAAAMFGLVSSTTGGPWQTPELQTLRNRGKAAYEEQQFGEAAVVFSRVIEAPDPLGQDHLNLALALYRSGDDPATLAALDDAGGLLNDHPGAPYLRGLIARRGGDLVAARAALQVARDLDPTDPAVRYNLGAVYAQLGLPEQATGEFEVVSAMGFDIGLQHYVSALYQHFQILLRDGRREEATPLIALYQEDSARLSPAARTPTALEESRWTAVHIPELTIQPADTASAGRVRFVPAAEAAAVPADARVAVADINRDGRQDWVVTGPTGEVWLSTASGYRVEQLATAAGPAAFGDFDRDGFADLYVASTGADHLLRNVLGDGVAPDAAPFVVAEARRLPGGGTPAEVSWGDYDHDGDLDVLVTMAEPQDGASLRLLQNLGDGQFTDTTEASGLAAPGLGPGALWADLDRDYDLDLFFWGEQGTALYSNARGGQFTEVRGTGADLDGPVADAVAEDLDNDGRIDLLLATGSGISVLRNLPEGAFAAVAVDGLPEVAVSSLAVADYNNDSYLDLASSGADGLRFYANGAAFSFAAFLPLQDTNVVPSVSARHLVAADLDGNGGVDVLVEDSRRLLRLEQTAPLGNWLTVALTGIKNNVEGIGSTVEVKAGGAYQVRPARSVPVHFGLGAQENVDVVRVRWPNGVVQNLVDAPANGPVEVTELERLEGSCPFLYTWNGEAFHFVNEVLGAAPLGMLLAEGVYHAPDPEEYVFVSGDHLAEVDGVYEIRVTEELRETVYLDAVRLIAVDHPSDLEILPNEGFGGPARPDLELFLYDELRPVRATDQRGRDWSAALATVDREWAVPFDPGAYDGLATPHSLTLELPEAVEPGEAIRLHLTGWVYWSMGSVNLAVDQDPHAEFRPVSLEVPDGRGGWRTAIDDIGLPIAKNTTLVVDLTTVLNRADPRVRLRTTMRLYWDAASYTVGGRFPDGQRPTGGWQGEHGVPRAGALELSSVGTVDAPLRAVVLSPTAARLRPRGFSAVSRSAEGFETFDYQEVVATAPWEQHRGYYTAFGEVVELLDAADDRYIVFGTGDEVAIRFEGTLPPPPAGWRRDYLVYMHGWLKDTDLNTAYGERVAPLPFHGMSGYPYPSSEGYPRDEGHQRFLLRYLTRSPRPINPPLGGSR